MYVESRWSICIFADCAHHTLYPPHCVPRPYVYPPHSVPTTLCTTLYTQYTLYHTLFAPNSTYTTPRYPSKAAQIKLGLLSTASTTAALPGGVDGLRLILPQGDSNPGCAVPRTVW
jgi:hypothetical protein